MARDIFCVNCLDLVPLAECTELRFDELGILSTTCNERAVAVNSVIGEVAILSRLKHPNIVTQHESFVLEGRLCIVMEFVDGTSLLDHVANHERRHVAVESRLLRSVARQLCCALQYLHEEAGVVHRDLTPTNILLSWRHPRSIKLTDFGLAKQYTHFQSGILGSTIGTMPYAAPEIVQQQPYTCAADLWSAGAVLYHLASGTAPFTGGNPLLLASNIVKGFADSHREALHARGPVSVSFFSMLMSVDPSKRPTAAAASAFSSSL